MVRLISGLIFGIALIIISLLFFNQYKFPYYYLPLPKYWDVEKIGFQKILEPDDFTLYYIDKMNAKGYDKKDVRYSAIYKAYKSSEKGSYVNISALIKLSGYTEEIDDAIVLQKYLLDHHLDFENRCYNYACANGDYISTLAIEYTRNMKMKRNYDEAFNTLKTMIISRKNDLRHGMRFSILEELYFLLNEMPFSQSELQFFDSELSELKKIQTGEKLEGRYKNLLVWKEKLHNMYNE